MYLVVEKVVPLRSELVNSIDIDRPHWARFINRQIFWPPIKLASARKNDSNHWIVTAACLQHRNLRLSVDGEIGAGIDHGIQVAGLAR